MGIGKMLINKKLLLPAFGLVFLAISTSMSNAFPNRDKDGNLYWEGYKDRPSCIEFNFSQCTVPNLCKGGDFWNPYPCSGTYYWGQIIASEQKSKGCKVQWQFCS